MQIRCPSFMPGAEIPARHTCLGEDVSPPLQWSGVPGGAKSLVLICEDPDAPAGVWTHWVLHGLAAESEGLPEALPKLEKVSLEGLSCLQGLNDFGKMGYGGPCPPPGPAHRYFFRLYALSGNPALSPRATKGQVLSALRGLVVAQAELVGRFSGRFRR